MTEEEEVKVKCAGKEKLKYMDVILGRWDADYGIIKGIKKGGNKRKNKSV